MVAFWMREQQDHSSHVQDHAERTKSGPASLWGASELPGQGKPPTQFVSWAHALALKLASALFRPLLHSPSLQMGLPSDTSYSANGRLGWPARTARRGQLYGVLRAVGVRVRACSVSVRGWGSTGDATSTI